MGTKGGTGGAAGGATGTAGSIGWVTSEQPAARKIMALSRTTGAERIANLMGAISTKGKYCKERLRVFGLGHETLTARSHYGLRVLTNAMRAPSGDQAPSYASGMSTLAAPPVEDMDKIDCRVVENFPLLNTMVLPPGDQAGFAP